MPSNDAIQDPQDQMDTTAKLRRAKIMKKQKSLRLEFLKANYTSKKCQSSKSLTWIERYPQRLPQGTLGSAEEGDLKQRVVISRNMRGRLCNARRTLVNRINEDAAHRGWTEKKRDSVSRLKAMIEQSDKLYMARILGSIAELTEIRTVSEARLNSNKG